MPLPPHTDVSLDTISALAERQGLPAHPIARLPETGIFNAVYLLGETYILRIPRRHPAHFHALFNESVAVPLARSVRVRTPVLVVYDDSCSRLPVPYTIYERVHGETLGRLDLEPDDTTGVWLELGEAWS